MGLVRQRVAWHWFDDNPFFVGEVEPCINGRVAALGAYFGEDSQRVVDRLLGEQMADGGWNCEQENGATVGSFHSTINVLEGLLEHERAGRGSPEVAAARQRGEEYLLSRALLRRLSTHEIVDPAFSRLSFPTGYHYDILRALDHFRAAGSVPDERMAEAIGVIESKRGAGRSLAARAPARRSARRRHRRAGGRAESVDHAPCDARPALVRGPLRPAGRIAKASLTDR